MVLWDVETGAQVHRFEQRGIGPERFYGHTDIVDDVTFSPDARYALSAGRDETIILWDIEDGSEVRRFERYQPEIAGIAVGPDGSTFLSGSSHDLVQCISF